MATFKELKDKLQGITPKKESPTEKSSDKDPVKNVLYHLYIFVS